MARTTRIVPPPLLVAILVVAGCQTASPGPSGSAPASPEGSDPSPASSASADLAVSEALRDAVGSEAIGEHLEALFDAAEAGDGSRASGVDG
jgi:hypothetical protein